MYDAVPLGSCYYSDIEGKGARGQISFIPGSCLQSLQCMLKMSPEQRQSDLIN